MSGNNRAAARVMSFCGWCIKIARVPREHQGWPRAGWEDAAGGDVPLPCEPDRIIVPMGPEGTSGTAQLVSWLPVGWWLLRCLRYFEQRAAYVSDVHYAD
jgi:hypothetical protein